MHRRDFLKQGAAAISTSVAGGVTLQPVAARTGIGAPISPGGKVSFKQSSFSPNPAGWTVWSDRAETKPRTFVDPLISRGGAGSLAISGDGNIGEYGGWQRAIPGVSPGTWYRFVAYYRATGLTSENWQIIPRLDWLTAEGDRAGSYEHVDYASKSERQGAWTKVTVEVEAPPRSAKAVLELYLAHAPLGIVWWDDITFEEIPPPGPRNVSIASINLKPENSSSPEESVSQFLETADRVMPPSTDLILFPEEISLVGTTKSAADVCEPIPGPTMERMSQLARRKHAYVAFGLNERDGAVYNSAVLLDRAGNLIGKYRKVHLPQGEIEQMVPGNAYPVFRTDFGTVGMMICYDVFFADPARALALQGAEIILMPIWGGPELLGKARALENQVFLVASGYDYPTCILDREGKTLAEAPRRGTAAVATIDLNKNYLYVGLWNWRNRRPREYHPEVVTHFRRPYEVNP
ncbi:MAG: carbon-nitrogen hydrolase family protein [Terriglobia bacterium]